MPYSIAQLYKRPRDYSLDKYGRQDEGIRLRRVHTDTLSCERGRPEVVKILLTRGADPEIADYKGNIPLAYSVDIPALTSMLRNDPDVEARDKTFPNNTGLFHMAWLGDIDGVKFYLSQNAKVERNVSTAASARPC